MQADTLPLLTAESEFSFHLLRSCLLNQFVTGGQPHIRTISPEKHKFARRGFLETSSPLRGEAMEHFPRCVREAWDSAQEPQEPEVRQLLRSVNPKEWQLPCYPRLGELSPDEEDFNPEEPSPPCRLLRPYCPKHGPRAQSPCRPRGESPAPNTTSAPGQESPTPSGPEDAALPESFPGWILPLEEPSV